MPLKGKYEVKLGRSFLDPAQNSFMSMRCDFLPASVDRNQAGNITISNHKEVDLRLPNVSGAEPSSTLFKGNIRPISKECLLIFNKKTGELTLERISKAAQLKKIRDDPGVRKIEVTQSSAPFDHQSCPKLPKTQTISESSSDANDKPSIASVPQQNFQRNRPSPPSQPPAQLAKRSTLSSSSDSDSDDDLGIPLGGIRGSVGINCNIKPSSPGKSSFSSLSSIDDEPSASSQIKSQPNRPKPQLSPSTQRRALMENDLHLTESDSEEDS